MRMNQKTSHDSPKKHWKKLFAIRKFLNLAHKQSSQSPAKELIFNKFYVGKKIANGSFGQIRLGAWIQNNKSVAIKLEHQAAKIPMLVSEYQLYGSLLNEVGFPKIYDYGSFEKYNALVMELLGPNLEELFMACNRSFSLSTILQIGIQLVTRMEVIHSHGITYRDVKPDNFLVGHSSQSKSNLIHVVDFGLAKKYIDPTTARHISYAENKFLTGTVRYMSINAHQGKEQSRRDDMEALSHVLFYFLTKGNLPWQNTPYNNIHDKYQTIRLIKEETSAIQFGSEFPWEFTVFLKYCRSLKFTQSPNYNYLRNLFRNCLKRLELQEDNIFDWMIPINGSNNYKQTLVLQTENEQIGKGNILQSFQSNTNSICQPFKSSINPSKTDSINIDLNVPKKIDHAVELSGSTSKSKSPPSSIQESFQGQSSIISEIPSKKCSDGVHQHIKHTHDTHSNDFIITQNLPGSLPDIESVLAYKPVVVSIPQINIDLCSCSEPSIESSLASLSGSSEENEDNSCNKRNDFPTNARTTLDPSSKLPSSQNKRNYYSTPQAFHKVNYSSTPHTKIPKVFINHQGLHPSSSSSSKRSKSHHTQHIVAKENESNLEKHVPYFMCCPFLSLWS
ncbi:uncharacterized protein [Lepeophtheirus salmonis]|uniref:uncharacterized protein n=1 Tax=Lepeophtheirus salmonis TaxID=72036 RepID=UPI001AEA0805|nr:casein kinase I homolog hhp1-like [Lepeophtheirus salmonis]